MADLSLFVCDFKKTAFHLPLCFRLGNFIQIKTNLSAIKGANIDFVLMSGVLDVRLPKIYSRFWIILGAEDVEGRGGFRIIMYREDI